MATAKTNFIEELEAQLTCVICKDIFTEPRTLPCLHTFCYECIKNWNDTCQRKRKPLECPTCRAAVKVEDGDVSKLPSSFSYNSLLQLFQAMKVTSDVQQQLSECANCNKCDALTAFCPECYGLICGDCINHHKTMRTLSTHQPTLLSEFKRQNINSYINNRSLCKEKFHEECQLEYYCKTCRKCICHKCAATTHSSHDKVSIEEAAEDAKKIIGKEKDQLYELLVKYETDLIRFNETFRNFQREVDTGKYKVRCHTQAVIKILQDHESATIAALDKKLEQRAREHEEEQRDVNVHIHLIAELKHQCETMANEQLQHYILEGYENLQQVCKATVQDESTVSSKSIKLNSSVSYSPNVEVIPLMQKLKLGEVVERVPNPSSYSESLSGVRYKAEKLSPCKVAMPTAGKQLKNSTQNVEIVDAKANLKPVMLVDLKEMKAPIRFAVSNRGDIAVINILPPKDSSVFLFSGDGEYLRHFGDKAAKKGHLSCPNGVLFNNDRILISDNTNRGYGILKEFGMDGKYIKKVCKLAEGMGVHAICTANQNIACLCYNCKSKESFVIFFDKHSFVHLRDIKLDVPYDGHGYPMFLSHGNNKIFVSFNELNAVCVFNENGSLLYTVGNEGNNEGQFDGIRGLAVFGEEMLLVCDLNNHRVQLFNQDGQFIRSFGGRGSTVGQINGPVDIRVSQDGRVFVLEIHSKRVQILK